MAEHGWVYQDNGIVVYRASSLGSCIRSLVAARLGESAAGPNAGLRAAMDASSGLEEECIRRFGIEMASDGVIWQQKEVELGAEVFEAAFDPVRIIVRGHIDGMYQLDDSILEVKALGEGNWAKWADGMNVHESLANLGTLGDKYRIQAALYGHATERKVRFVIGQKGKKATSLGDGSFDWVIDELDVSPPIDPNDLYSLSDLHARIAFIEDHASWDELPECDAGCREGDPYSECHIWAAPKAGGDELFHLLNRRDELQQQIDELSFEYESINDKVKAEFGIGEFTAGKYTAKVTWYNGGRCDTKSLKRKRPEIYEEFYVPAPPSMRLNVSGGWKKSKRNDDA